MKIKTKLKAIGLVLAFVVTMAFIGRAEDKTIIDNSKELFKHVQLFADAITLISTDYVEPVNAKDLVYGAIKGMMRQLGGYNQFLEPESFKEITEETKGEFGGLGISVGMRDDVLTVISPMEGGPAFLAGIKAGDKIVKIDGKITRDMAFEEAVKKLRGNPGTKVSLTIIREKVDKVLEFKLKRTIIKLKSIKDSRIVEDNIGYIKIVEFQERTAKDLNKNITELRKEGAENLILDLRNNPGGLLDSAIELSDLFLKPGAMIVYTEGRNPEKRMEFKAKSKSEFDDMDLVIIVDKESASAAEIVAGALKDNQRALIVGVPTFGKGSVQTVIPLEDKSALRLTTASYFTPSGKNLRDKGIEPDIYIERKKLVSKKMQQNMEKDKFKVFKRVEKNNRTKSKDVEKKEAITEYDNQMQAAINILKGIEIFEKYKDKNSSEEIHSKQ